MQYGFGPQIFGNPLSHGFKDFFIFIEFWNHQVNDFKVFPGIPDLLQAFQNRLKPG